MKTWNGALTGLLLAVAAAAAAADDTLSDARLAPVRKYIKEGWTTLTRGPRDIVRAAPDPKLHLPPGTPWPVYVSAREDRAKVERELTARLSPAERRQIALRVLPKDPLSVTEHGLLYLPHPYVVPGGRFNEMYGWDSYFIQVGLLLDGETDKARALAENFLYEIDHYGTILNANRTYFLSRSQPPFLTRMLLGVYDKTGDRQWLAAAWPAVEKYYAFWTTEPHLEPQTGLSRYYDLADTPGAEVVSDEKDAEGRTHYDRAREYYKTHRVADYDVSRFYDAKKDRLTPLFYRGDRSMRESGFDPSSRFGPFSVDIVHHVPVCLNALLFVMEEDAARIARPLGRAGRAVPRLQLRDRQAPRLPVRDHLLPAVGGSRVAGAGEARAGRRRAAHGPGRRPDQHREERQPVGRPLRLGAAPDLRGGRPAPLRAPRGGRPAGPRVRRHGRQGVRGAREDPGEVRRGAPRVGRRGRNPLRLQRQPGRLRLDECGRAGSAGGARGAASAPFRDALTARNRGGRGCDLPAVAAKPAG
jgi:hypothetical protein